MHRRQFLAAAAIAALADRLGLVAGRARAAAPEIPRRRLGRTGEEVSVVGLGGFHVGAQADPGESVRLVRAAIDAGITFLDNSWDYNGGDSEIRMGLALQDGYRRRAFLMTKFDGRTRAAAARQIDESLRRLRTDHVDLLQFHEIIRPDDPDRIFAAEGAIEAALAARRAGKARFLGFTGHKAPAIHLAMLRACEAHGFTPDTVQLPLNPMDAGHDSFQAQVLPALVQRGIGVLGMKPFGDHFVLDAGVASAEELLRYAMSVPGVGVTITGIDRPEVLAQAVDVARGFTPLSGELRRELERRAAAMAATGTYERYKSSDHFDSTAHHPEWLG